MMRYINFRIQLTVLLLYLCFFFSDVSPEPISEATYESCHGYSFPNSQITHDIIKNHQREVDASCGLYFYRMHLPIDFPFEFEQSISDNISKVNQNENENLHILQWKNQFVFVHLITICRFNISIFPLPKYDLG